MIEKKYYTTEDFLSFETYGTQSLVADGDVAISDIKLLFARYLIPEDYNFERPTSLSLLPEEKLYTHQTSGYYCYHPYLRGWYLDVREEFKNKLRELVKKLIIAYDGGNYDVGCWSLNSLIEYRETLKSYFPDFNCNCSHKYLQEALYPIDGSYELAKKYLKGGPDLTTKQIPLLVFYNLFIVTENSD